MGRQKNYQYRQGMLSESSMHEESIIFRRSPREEMDDDGNEFDDLAAAGASGGPMGATEKAVAAPADDLASMEFDYSSLVDRLVFQLQQLAKSNVEMAEKQGVAAVKDVEKVIESGNPTMLFEKIRHLKQANQSLSKNATVIKKKKIKKKNSSSIVPMSIDMEDPGSQI